MCGVDAFLIPVRVSSRKTVLAPRVGGVGVAAHFPEAVDVAIKEDDIFQPLGSFPYVEFGDDHKCGSAMLHGDWRAISCAGD